MPPTKGKGVARDANRRREEEESESESEGSEEDESSSEESESGESEVSLVKPRDQFDSDDSRKMSDEEKTNKRPASRKKGPSKAASNAAPDDDDQPEHTDIHKDDPTYKDDERVLVSGVYLEDMMKHAKLVERENKELMKSVREHKKELRQLRSENRTTVRRGRKSMVKDHKMSQADHANMSRIKEIVKKEIWQNVKRLQKKDLVYSTTAGTVCHIVMSSDAIQWTDSCDGEEDRKWYHDTRVGPWINVALQELMSANNDATREQYKCE